MILLLVARLVHLWPQHVSFRGVNEQLFYVEGLLFHDGKVID